jgi:hypothetical protein
MDEHKMWAEELAVALQNAFDSNENMTKEVVIRDVDGDEYVFFDVKTDHGENNIVIEISPK